MMWFSLTQDLLHFVWIFKCVFKDYLNIATPECQIQAMGVKLHIMQWATATTHTHLMTFSAHETEGFDKEMGSNLAKISFLVKLRLGCIDYKSCAFFYCMWYFHLLCSKFPFGGKDPRKRVKSWNPPGYAHYNCLFFRPGKQKRFLSSFFSFHVGWEQSQARVAAHH